MIIFVDETTYYENVNSGKQFVGTGILTVDNLNSVDATIDEAFQTLIADPDIHSPKTKAFDSRTITNQYFHACEDSKNGHSAICSSISKNLVGDFHYNYREVTDGYERAFQDTFLYAGVQVSTTRSPVKMFIEKRTGFSHLQASRLIEHVFNAIEWGAYELVAIPKFFPDCEISFVGKDNKGIQITDFIMWAKNRMRTNPPNKIWESRLKFTSKSSAGEIGQDIDQGDIVFKRGVKHDLHLGVYPKDAFPLGTFKGNQHLVDLFIFIDAQVRKFILDEFNLTHIRVLYNDIALALKNNSFVYNTETVRKIASCYIRIFDMKPIYTDADKTAENFRELLLSKKLAGLVIRKDLIQGTRTAQFLAQTMRSVKNQK